jgi:hypothetical protein
MKLLNKRFQRSLIILSMGSCLFIRCRKEEDGPSYSFISWRTEIIDPLTGVVSEELPDNDSRLFIGCNAQERTILVKRQGKNVSCYQFSEYTRGYYNYCDSVYWALIYKISDYQEMIAINLDSRTYEYVILLHNKDEEIDCNTRQIFNLWY